MLTPVEVTRDGIYLKRDDLYRAYGARGAKARSVEALIGNDEVRGLVTCGPLNSSQVGVVGRIARELGVPCRVHLPDGVLGDGPMSAAINGANAQRHPGASLDDLNKEAKDDADEREWTHIPLGCSGWPTVVATCAAAANLPKVKRIVVPVGTGTQLCGVLWGVMASRVTEDVLGVVRCNDVDLPKRTLAKYGPPMRVMLVEGDRDPVNDLNGIELNSAYEAYAAAYAEPGDLLWLVGGPCSWE